LFNQQQQFVVPTPSHIPMCVLWPESFFSSVWRKKVLSSINDDALLLLLLPADDFIASGFIAV
jgi:hypothetical protein